MKSKSNAKIIAILSFLMAIGLLTGAYVIRNSVPLSLDTETHGSQRVQKIIESHVE